jgi:MerR family transcriptional regulator, copper efflux regulator
VEELSITAAAEGLGTTPRMLRYRETLGLSPAGRPAGSHRRYGPAELRALALAMRLEQQYDVSPRALAFALRAVVDPILGGDLRRLAEVSGLRPERPLAALDFEQEKARRLLPETGEPIRRKDGWR